MDKGSRQGVIGTSVSDRTGYVIDFTFWMYNVELMKIKKFCSSVG